jgi:ribonuclease HII
MSIAAASVLANISDDYMNRIHEEFPCITGNKIKAIQPKNTETPLENTALLNTIE